MRLPPSPKLAGGAACGAWIAEGVRYGGGSGLCTGTRAGAGAGLGTSLDFGLGRALGADFGFGAGVCARDAAGFVTGRGDGATGDDRVGGGGDGATEAPLDLLEPVVDGEEVAGAVVSLCACFGTAFAFCVGLGVGFGAGTGAV